MQWKLRFFGSALGYLWQLIRPLLLFVVLYVFFTQIAHVGKGRGRAELPTTTARSCSASIVLFTFFAEATVGAVRSVVDNETLVRKIQFPRMVIPLSIVLLALFNLCLNLVVVTDLRAGRRRPADAQLARAAADRRAAGGPRDRNRDAAVVAVRLLPRHRSRSGRCSPRSCSTPRR